MISSRLTYHFHVKGKNASSGKSDITKFFKLCNFNIQPVQPTGWLGELPTCAAPVGVNVEGIAGPRPPVQRSKGEFSWVSGEKSWFPFRKVEKRWKELFSFVVGHFFLGHFVEKWSPDTRKGVTTGGFGIGGAEKETAQPMIGTAAYSCSLRWRRLVPWTCGTNPKWWLWMDISTQEIPNDRKPKSASNKRTKKPTNT